MHNKEKVSLDSQINKLELISKEISNLIASGKTGKINHLDQLRRKIINDIKNKRIKIDQENQKNIKNLISLNSEMVINLQEIKSKKLKEIDIRKNCAKAYYKNN